MDYKTILVACFVLSVGLSCRPDDQKTETLDPIEGMAAREAMSEEVVAQLDSGSLQFREHDFAAALIHYRRVAEMEPDLAAGWFGVYMAEQALGNLDAAAGALERARGTEPGAALIHPAAGDTSR